MTVSKEQLAALNDEKLIVIVLDAGIDSQVAQRWLKANAPKAVNDLRVLTELRLMQLQAGLSVCACFRSPETPALTHAPDAAGVIRGTTRPDKDMFAEMVVTEPVKVGDHWTRPSATSPGEPHIPRLLEALNATLLPYRLDFIDKGEARPTIMKLTTL